MRKHVGPIIAVIVLALPLLYVASYFALVQPSGVFYPRPASPYSHGIVINGQLYSLSGEYKTYRAGNAFCKRFYWPLEQADRKLRPSAWRAVGW